MYVTRLVICGRDFKASRYIDPETDLEWLVITTGDGFVPYERMGIYIHKNVATKAIFLGNRDEQEVADVLLAGAKEWLNANVDTAYLNGFKTLKEKLEFALLLIEEDKLY